MTETATPCELVLDELLRRAPLPEAWRLAERFIERSHIGRLELQLVGVVGELRAEIEQGTATTRQVTGSAAGDHADITATRAYFELLERASVVEAQRLGEPLEVCDLQRLSTRRLEPKALIGEDLAPTQRRSYSNGVACAQDWASACQSAWHELIERDALLRSWYGQLRFQPCEGAEPWLGPFELAGAYYRAQSYWLAHCGAVVAFVVAWPLEQPQLPAPATGVPLVYGSAARGTLTEAQQAASRECAQRLGFLWGEPLPQEVPELAADPAYHQECFLVAGAASRLRAWLQGEHANFGVDVDSPPTQASIAQAHFVDLTPASARERYVVVKAEHGALLPLVFGKGHPHCRDLPQALEVHPVA